MLLAVRRQIKPEILKLATREDLINLSSYLYFC